MLQIHGVYRIASSMEAAVFWWAHNFAAICKQVVLHCHTWSLYACTYIVLVLSARRKHPPHSQQSLGQLERRRSSSWAHYNVCSQSQLLTCKKKSPRSLSSLRTVACICWPYDKLHLGIADLQVPASEIYWRDAVYKLLPVNHSMKYDVKYTMNTAGDSVQGFSLMRCCSKCNKGPLSYLSARWFNFQNRLALELSTDNLTAWLMVTHMQVFTQQTF